MLGGGTQVASQFALSGDITANIGFRNQRLLHPNLAYAKLHIFAKR